jgi:hypothetical protein
MRHVVPPVLALGCTAALVVACFGSVLFGDRQLAYRDAGHFYYPLYRRVQQEWEAGRWPLWEPEENGGQPLLGNPTAAVLYPGKVLYAVLPYPWAAKVYPIAHVLLGGATMYALMRHWQTSRTGAAIAALAYAFGEPVLYQYSNIVFLVGAAWVPVGLRGADRWLRLGRRWGLVELALALALMTLGGDPQAAYVVGLCAGGYAVGLAMAGRRPWSVPRWVLVLSACGLVLAWVTSTLAAAAWWPARSQPIGTAPGTADPVPNWPWPRIGPYLLLGVGVAIGLIALERGRRGAGRQLLRMLAGVVGAGALAGALTGVQILPALEYVGRSDRAAEDGTHAIFSFSLEPHRLLELAWPGVYGRAMSNRYWLGLVPPQHEIMAWVPSLYLGVLTLVLALGSVGLRRGPPWRRWLSAIALAGGLLGLGQFGSPLWLARNVPALVPALGPHDPWYRGELRGDGYLADGFGSPYWILARVLPGFGAFRYPSKLLTFAALALAGLAGAGWDRAVAGDRRRPAVVAAAVLILGVLTLGGTIGWEDRIFSWWRGALNLSLITPFGPFDPAGALAETRRGLAQGSLAALLALLLLSATRRSPRAAGAMALLVLTADLGAANARFVRSVPQSLLDEADRPAALRLIEEAERAAGSTGPYRIHRAPDWVPRAWHRSSAVDRERDIVSWERKTVRPRYAIPFGACYTVTAGTAERSGYWSFFTPISGHHPAADRQAAAPLYFPRRGFDLWNTKYFVLPFVLSDDAWRGFASLLPETEVVYPPPSLFEGPEGPRRLVRWRLAEDWQILRNKAAYPRAWIVHRVRPIRPLAGSGRRDREAVMAEILYQADPFWNEPGRIPWDPREVAWVESDRAGDLAPAPSGGPADPDEGATITASGPQRVVLDVRLNQPGLVVLAETDDPGWRLTIDGTPRPIVRTNLLMRGAAVASGAHRLVFTYEPRSLKVGLAMTLLGLVALIGASAWSHSQPR